jgi:hypothetical protein
MKGLYAAHQLNVGDLDEEARLATIQLSGLDDLVLNEEIRTCIRSVTVTAFELPESQADRGGRDSLQRFHDSRRPGHRTPR